MGMIASFLKTFTGGSSEGNLKALHNLPKVSLDSKTKREKAGDQWKLTTTLVNHLRDPLPDGAPESDRQQER